MKTYLFLHPEQVTQQQLEQEILPQLPAWRRELAQKFRHLIGQVLCAEAYLLLKEGLRTDFGITDEVSFDYLEHGKPVLKEYPNIHFNLSHCLKGVLCVIDDQGPVGCDVEAIDRTINESLLQHCCNEEEICRIRTAPNPDAEFMKLWTIKEAVLKYTGQGLVQDLPSLLSPEMLATIQLCTCEKDGVVFTTCRAR